MDATYLNHGPRSTIHQSKDLRDVSITLSVLLSSHAVIDILFLIISRQVYEVHVMSNDLCIFIIAHRSYT